MTMNKEDAESTVAMLADLGHTATVGTCYVPIESDSSILVETYIVTTPPASFMLLKREHAAGYLQGIRDEQARNNIGGGGEKRS
jgi:hypothetical protein